MSLNISQFREYVIDPTLKKLGLYSKPASDLILGTAIQESRLKYLHQLGGGPALGICQMEPYTHDSIVRNYLKYRPELHEKLLLATGVSNLRSEYLITNLAYSVAMARIHYLPKAGAIPAELAGQAEYWKKHYNTYLGAGTIKEYIRNWNNAHA